VISIEPTYYEDIKTSIALIGNQVGKDKEADKKLDITVKMNPSSEIGRSADSLLNNM